MSLKEITIRHFVCDRCGEAVQVPDEKEEEAFFAESGFVMVRVNNDSEEDHDLCPACVSLLKRFLANEGLALT